MAARNPILLKYRFYNFTSDAERPMVPIWFPRQVQINIQAYLVCIEN